MEKDRLRAYGIAARNAYPAADRLSANTAVCARLAALKAFRDAGTVMGYCAFGGEANVDAVMLEAKCLGKNAAYPHCVNKTDMIALAPNRFFAWNSGCFGIRTPDPSHSDVILPEEIDLVILPCTAFDERGNRIGMGAGYYDRFLLRCTRAVKVIAALDCQCVAGIEPSATDVPADVIVTEKRTINCRRLIGR